MYCVHHLVNMKLGSPVFKVLQKIGDEKFVPGLLGKMVTSSLKILARRLFSWLQPWAWINSGTAQKFSSETHHLFEICVHIFQTNSKSVYQYFNI